MDSKRLANEHKKRDALLIVLWNAISRNQTNTIGTIYSEKQAENKYIVIYVWSKQMWSKCRMMERHSPFNHL